MDTKDKIKAALVITIMGAAIISLLFPDNKPATKHSDSTMKEFTEKAIESMNAKTEHIKRLNETYGYTDYEAEHIRKYEAKKVAKPAKESSRVEEFMDEIDDYQSKVNDLEETIDDLNAEIDRLNSILDRVTD